jgi:hypothetical protein
MNRVVCLAALLPLCGCISTAPTDAQMANNAKMCSSFGYQAGSRAHADCQFSMAQRSADNNEIAKARAHAFFRSLQ